MRQLNREKGYEGGATLDRWLACARRRRLPPFTQLAKTIGPRREGIEAAIRTRLANAGSKVTNNGVRLLTRLAFGFHSPAALIALIKLKFGGVRIPLPFRYAWNHR